MISRHSCKINEASLIALEKVIRRQFILHIADRPASLDQFSSHMEIQVMVDHFHLINGADSDLARAAFYGDRNIIIRTPRPDLRDRALDRL